MRGETPPVCVDDGCWCGVLRRHKENPGERCAICTQRLTSPTTTIAFIDVIRVAGGRSCHTIEAGSTQVSARLHAWIWGTGVRQNAHLKTLGVSNLLLGGRLWHLKRSFDPFHSPIFPTPLLRDARAKRLTAAGDHTIAPRMDPQEHIVMIWGTGWYPPGCHPGLGFHGFLVSWFPGFMLSQKIRLLTHLTWTANTTNDIISPQPPTAPLNRTEPTANHQPSRTARTPFATSMARVSLTPTGAAPEACAALLL